MQVFIAQKQNVHNRISSLFYFILCIIKYMESLGKIFGSNNRVKIMRLFLFNQSQSFDIEDVVERSLLKKIDARKELTLLTKVDFLKIKKTKGRIPKTKWSLNKKFNLLKPFQDLLIYSELVQEDILVKKINKTGTIKLLILSGLFTRDKNRKIDILIVGDKIKRDALYKIIQTLESEIGHELMYSVFDTQEFAYRIGMYDKLVRDVVENKHRVLLKKIDY